MLYRPTLRPAGYAPMPSGVRWGYVEMPADIAHQRRDLPVSTHLYGVVDTDRRLTDDEMDRYALVQHHDVRKEARR